MPEPLHLIAAAIALIACACAVFARPERALLLSALMGAVAALGAGVIWRAAPGGELAPWLAVMLVGLAAAILFATAALLRHLLNALGARALF